MTDTDRTLERHTRRVLTAEFPQVPVLGEGYGGDDGLSGVHHPMAPMRWGVDPVDGTANYVAGFPWCAYSLALVDAFGPVVGVIADPNRAQIYAAARGRGVRANGVPVRVLARRDPAGGLVCSELGPERAPGFTRRAAAAHTGVRALGSAALAITQVALGHAVAAVLDGYREWDVAGALCLAAEAGAVITDGEGRPDPLPTDGLVVAAPGVLDTVLSWWGNVWGLGPPATRAQQGPDARPKVGRSPPHRAPATPQPPPPSPSASPPSCSSSSGRRGSSSPSTPPRTPNR